MSKTETAEKFERDIEKIRAAVLETAESALHPPIVEGTQTTEERERQHRIWQENHVRRIVRG